MKVPYTKLSPGAFPWMPLLKVRLRGPTGVVEMPMLVDSGSSETTIPEAMLQKLGVELSDETAELAGFTGHLVVGRVAQVEIAVDGARFVSRVVAVPDAFPAIPILGHQDFFRNYWVAFDSANLFFHVSPARKR
jgi:predicted aspartyl protease